MSETSPDLFHVAHPPRRAATGLAPGLLLLHGRGADEQDLLPLADELDPRLFVVSARAPGRLGPGYAWYDLAGIGAPEPASFDRSVERLTGFVERLPRVYAIDPAGLFVLGFSQGAVMSGALLLSRPELLAGTIMLSGYLPVDAGLRIDEARLANAPVLVAHGEADPVIPVVAGRQSRDYLARVGADLTYYEYPIGHTIGPEELRDVASWLDRR